MGIRRAWRCCVASVLVLAVAGCALPAKVDVRSNRRPGTVSTSAGPPPTSTRPVPTPTPVPPVDFEGAINRAVAAVPDGHVTLAVYDRQDNRMAAGRGADETTYTESVVKLLIGLASLDRGGSAAEVATMLSHSDDSIARTLWGRYGGSQIVTGMAAKIGLKNTTPPGRAGYWGDSRTTAADLVRVYRYILDTAPAAERTTVLTALGSAAHVAADGNDQWFGIPDALEGSTPRAVKQGWACCEPGWILNTTGLIGADHRYIVIVLVAFRSRNGSGLKIPQKYHNEITDAVEALLPDLDE